MAFRNPLTGSVATGQLGLAHLPRMWQQALLKSAPRPRHDAAIGECDFDRWMMDGIGIDAISFRTFLQTRPTYFATEAWVRTHATKLNNLGPTNERILGHSTPARDANELRAAAGILDQSFDNTERLANLDDLVELRSHLLAHRGETLDAIVPAITSLASGPLGVLHLPRLWGKAIIKASDALPDGYFSGSGPLDEQLAETIGIDLAASVRFTAILPSYIAYESWVKDVATNLDPATVAAWNERTRTREKRVEVATEERLTLGITDGTERHTRLLNDLLDWQLLHEQVMLKP